MNLKQLTTIIILLASTLPARTVFAEIASINWNKSFNSSTGANEEANALTLDTSGNLLVTGRTGVAATNDLLLIKYDISGGILWQKSDDIEGGDDEAFAITTDTSDNIYLAGRSHNSIAYGAVIIKYDTQGEEIWFDKDGNPAPLRIDNNIHLEARGVILDSNNDLIVTGFANEGISDKIFLAKYRQNSPGAADINGTKKEAIPTLIWKKFLSPDSFTDTSDGSTVITSGNALAIDQAGNYYVAGRFSRIAPFNSNTNITIKNSDDLFIAKFSTDGLLLWAKNFDFGFRELASGIAIKNNIYITGTTSSASSLNNYILLKLSLEGGMLWADPLVIESAQTSDSARAITLDNSENIYITGSSDNTAKTMKLDTNGNTIWTTSLAGSLKDIAFGIVADNSSGGNAVDIYIAGTTTNKTDLDTLVVKYVQSDNHTPTISFPTGFTSGISLESGTDTTDFEFRLIYTDADNDPPTAINLNIDDKKTAMLPLANCGTLCDGIYTDGEVFSTVIKLSTGDHTFFFDYADQLSVVKTDKVSNPSVVSFLPVTSSGPSELNLEIFQSTKQANQLQPSTFTVLNSGLSTLNWSASTPGDWLSLSPSTGTQDDTVTVTYDTSSLGTGFFRTFIEITNDLSEPYRLPVNLLVKNREDLFAFEGDSKYDSGKNDTAAGVESRQGENVFMLESTGRDLRLTSFNPTDIKDGNRINGTIIKNDGQDFGKILIRSNKNSDLFVLAESGEDIMIARFNAFINKEWSRFYEGNGRISLVSSSTDITGNVYILIYDSKLGYFILKYDSDGNIRPTYQVVEPFTTINDIYVDSNLSIFLGGSYNTDFKIKKLDFELQDKGSFTFNSSRDDRLNGVLLDNRNFIIAYGESGGNIILVKFDPEGVPLYEKIFDSGAVDRVVDAVIDSQNNIYLLGDNGSDILIIKYDLNGVKIWEIVYESGETDIAAGITLSDENKLIISSTIIGEPATGGKSNTNRIFFSQKITGEVIPEVQPEPVQPDNTQPVEVFIPKTTGGCFLNFLLYE